MKTIVLSLILAIPASALVATPPAKPTNKTIVVGRNIGDIRLGDRLSEVESRYGEAPDVDTTMGVVIEPWKVPGGMVEIQTHRPNRRAEIVTSVRTTSPQYHIADGLHVGSRLSEVRARYPHGNFSSAEFVSFVGDKGGWLYNDSGVDFQFTAKDNSAHCIAIRAW